MLQVPAYVFEYGANFAFWASVSVLAGTSLIWPWWKSFWGINIVSLESALALALLPFVMSYDFGVRIGNSPPFAWTEAASLWLMGAVIVWRGFLVIQQQLRSEMGMSVRDALGAARLPRRRRRGPPGKRGTLSPPGNGDGYRRRP